MVVLKTSYFHEKPMKLIFIYKSWNFIILQNDQVFQKMRPEKKIFISDNSFFRWFFIFFPRSFLHSFALLMNMDFAIRICLSSQFIFELWKYISYANGDFFFLFFRFAQFVDKIGKKKIQNCWKLTIWPVCVSKHRIRSLLFSFFNRIFLWLISDGFKWKIRSISTFTWCWSSDCMKFWIIFAIYEIGADCQLRYRLSYKRILPFLLVFYSCVTISISNNTKRKKLSRHISFTRNVQNSDFIFHPLWIVRMKDKNFMIVYSLHCNETRSYIYKLHFSLSQ